jgi:hypothetical protein
MNRVKIVDFGINAVQSIGYHVDEEKLREIGYFLLDNCCNEGFSVDLDEVYQLIMGYRHIKHARSKFKNCNFIENVDYIITYPYKSRKRNKNKGGFNKKKYFLTTNCFQRFLMEAQTKKCEIVRQFYIQIMVWVKNNHDENKLSTIMDDIIPDIKEHTFYINSHNLHDDVRDRIATEYNGKVEVQNIHGISDVENDRKVFEVKPISEWKHGLGQVQAYSLAANKAPVLVLFGLKKPEKHVLNTCSSLNVEIIYVKITRKKQKDILDTDLVSTKYFLKRNFLD